MTQPIISIKDLTKQYGMGYMALDSVSLDIKRGEIFALLGSNGAGKTTLISCICGILNQTSGYIKVDGFDTTKDYKKSREIIGLVPQELTLGMFDKVFNTVSFSRGLFGKKPNKAFVSQLLRDLSLSDKINNQIRSLSGGMKRRVLIAKALSHEPKILFLDEPTSGVDVRLRKDMWAIIKGLRDSGVTIILTTHYIEEAEEIADRIGFLNNGKLELVEKTSSLMSRLGSKKIIFDISPKVSKTNTFISKLRLTPENNGNQVLFDPSQSCHSISDIIVELKNNNFQVDDVHTESTSLEDIFLKFITTQHD